MHTALLFAVMATAPADYAGNWDVKLSANYSTCKDRRAGDALSEQWVVTAVNGKLAVKITSSSAGAATYKGEIKSDDSLWFEAGPEVGVELHGSTSNLAGRRVVASHSGLTGTCAVIYDINMTKAK